MNIPMREDKKAMLEVNFYEAVDDNLIEFAVIIAKSKGKWVLCRHKDRTTYEVPGGHREPGEIVLDTAKRELYEETGAITYTIYPICVYSVKETKLSSDLLEETFGMLYYAEISVFGDLPDYEMGEVLLLDELPDFWTYPLIQPKLLKKVEEKINEIY